MARRSVPLIEFSNALKLTMTVEKGIPPKKTEFKDKESLMNHTWPFFNAQFQTAEFGSGADIVKPVKGPSATTTEIGVTDSSLESTQRRPVNNNLSAKEAKQLSLSLNQSRSFGKDDRAAKGGSTVAQKGYRTFTPGDYYYNFELPIDSRLPESITVDLGSVKYELEAIVERAGAFRSNLVGCKEVTLIRAPSEGSLEQVEPIAISRNWEDQLHYDIVISGKSFPLGAQVPIAFKLTPLAKVQCHRIKVFVTENIQYYTSNKRVHRLEPIRKFQLFEKRADAPSSSAYPGSSVRITAGGGVAYDGRAAAARGDENVPRDTSNLLGNLEGEHNVGPTEMEFSVQLPSCHNMKETDKFSRLHFDTTYQGIQIHHWIKVDASDQLHLLQNADLRMNTDCNEVIKARRRGPNKAEAFRNLHRFTIPHPLLPRHPSQYRPSCVYISRVDHTADGALFMWLPRCPTPSKLTLITVTLAEQPPTN